MNKEQQQITELCEDINDMYGVDAMYYGVDSYAIAHHLYEKDYRKRREGEWILVKNGHGVCSVCNRQDNIDTLAHFCRYCGARMKGSE